MGVTFRPFVKHDDDYVLMRDMIRVVWPDMPTTVEKLKHDDGTLREDLLHERFVLELDGRPVGIGMYQEPHWSYQAGKYDVRAMVVPEARGRGVGTAFYKKVLADLAGREPRPVKLVASSREDQVDGVRFLERHGFKLVMRYPNSSLDVQGFDVEGYRPLWERVAQSGIVVKTLTELLETDEHCRQKFYELFEHKIMLDVPSPDPYTPPSFEEFSKLYFGHPDFESDATFLALDGDAYVGVSALFPIKAEPGKYFTSMTGVLRDYRRRGLARALKVYAIEYVQVNGGHTIKTDNEENNPMYDLNMQLGFRPEPAWVDYERPWGGGMSNEQ